MSFNKDFVWGAATAAYQIEGAAYEDGKGLSVWDVLCKKDGFVKSGHTGDVACDHYHKFKEDIAVMKEMGLKAYRLSISWSRIIPNGTGEVNEKGLKFYDELIDELLKNGIEPYVTLFHWDYPYELYLRGGWMNPESPLWFEEYTKVVVERLSDRVKNWMTINEPQCFIGLGLYQGDHAPGLKVSKHDFMRAVHNTLLSHGRAVKTIRKYSKQDCKVGFAPVVGIATPKTDSPQDIEAAKRAMFGMKEFSIWNNCLWIEPVYTGKYHQDVINLMGEYMPEIKEGDMELISQPLDFFGMNNYNSSVVYDENGETKGATAKAGAPRTAFNWGVTPEGLYWGPKFFYERYKKPILITENGLSNTDWVSLDGKVHDPQRIDFLNRYLLQYKKACEEGVETMGYFQWSLMDNFEWAYGYHERFGLVYVDFETQERIIKDSGHWYKTVIESNGEVL